VSLCPVQCVFVCILLNAFCVLRVCLSKAVLYSCDLDSIVYVYVCYDSGKF